MIIILKKGASVTEIENLKALLESKNITPHVSQGELETIVGCVGDIAHLDPGVIEAMDSVESVQRIQEPYKAANRKFHPDDTVIDCGGAKIGGGSFAVIAGPCSVESEEQLVGVAKAVKAAGATMLRGGAFKPRTSPYAFQGLGEEGLRILSLAKKETGLPIVTELMDFKDIELFNDVDVIQIGARNMQKFNLLKEVGSYTQKPILLKRGMSATLQELLMSAEYGDRPRLDGGLGGGGGDGDRGRRPHHRGPQRPAAREVRRRAEPDAGDVRRDDEARRRRPLGATQIAITVV